VLDFVALLRLTIGRIAEQMNNKINKAEHRRQSHPCVQTPDSTAAYPGTCTKSSKPQLLTEIGGPIGPEPTRYGDWEKNGRCSDF